MAHALYFQAIAAEADDVVFEVLANLFELRIGERISQSIEDGGQFQLLRDADVTVALSPTGGALLLGLGRKCRCWL